MLESDVATAEAAVRAERWKGLETPDAAHARAGEVDCRIDSIDLRIDLV